MIQRERPLEAFGSLLARGKQGAGVVGEHVDRSVALAHLLGQLAYAGPRLRAGKGRGCNVAAPRHDTRESY